MPELKIAGGTTRLHYEDAGSGRTLVLIHGFPFDSSLWRPQIEALSATHRVIAPDIRGFGRSSQPPEPYTIARLADDLAAILDAAGVDRAVVGGLSMGGYITFEFLRRHAHLAAGLVLADTRPEPDDEEGKRNRRETAQQVRSRGSDELVDELLPKLLHPETSEKRPAVEATLREMMMAAKPDAIAAALMAMSERSDSPELLERIHVPTLVLGGDADALTPPDQTRAWANRIPDARVAILEHAGHVSNLEQPAAFNAALLDFLSTIGSHPTER